jgi:hypothetical protein
MSVMGDAAIVLTAPDRQTGVWPEGIPEGMPGVAAGLRRWRIVVRRGSSSGRPSSTVMARARVQASWAAPGCWALWWLSPNQKECARLALDQEERGKREENKPPRRMVAQLVITLMVMGGIAVWIA